MESSLTKKSLKTLDIQELGIVVIAKNYNPTLLNIDLLQSSGLVPSDWELARSPVCSTEGSQLIFKNKINLVAFPNRLHFLEAVDNKPFEEIKVVDLMSRYVKTLANLDYQAVGINPKGHTAFPNFTEAQHYINKTLLSPGSWQEIGKEPMKAALRISYTLEEGELFLSIDGASVQLPDQEELTSMIIFTGNFNRDLTEGDRQQRTQELIEFLGGWQKQLEVYRRIINEQFLKF